MADKLINAETLKLATSPEKVIEKWREHSNWTLSQVFHSFIDDAPGVSIRTERKEASYLTPNATSNILADGIGEERAGRRLSSSEVNDILYPNPVFVKTYSGGSYTGRYWALCKHGIFLDMSGSVTSYNVLNTKKPGMEISVFMYSPEKISSGFTGYLIPPSELYSIKTPYPVKLIKSDGQSSPFWGLLSKGMIIFYVDDFKKMEGQKVDSKVANFDKDIYTIGNLRAMGYTIKFDNYLVIPEKKEEDEDSKPVEIHQEGTDCEPGGACTDSNGRMITW